jgi:hypothetical protein
MELSNMNYYECVICRRQVRKSHHFITVKCARCCRLEREING